MRTIQFGIIGCGLMGREFASAIARWGHLLESEARPEVVAICSRNPARHGWFKENCPALNQITDNYSELIGNSTVEAVYAAVPHHLHQEVYCAAIAAGKHLMGEKPFGIDVAANTTITDCLREHPEVLARCSSQFPFYPAAQRIGDLIVKGAFGRIIEVNCGFLHSSDLDPNKPINWKRMVELNGAYGCLGDLGMHTCHVPFRAGWWPRNVRAIVSDIVKERPDAQGKLAPCNTPDNATLFCEAADPASGELFPLTIKTQRIAPGQKNTWYLEISGTQAAAKFSTANPARLDLLEYHGGEQIWGRIQVGYEPAFKTITGGIFEFGFTDAILQMWAAFLYELVHQKPLKRFAGCATPEEVAFSHRLFTAALRSQQTKATIEL
jgi:predicted dehydrogenase